MMIKLHVKILHFSHNKQDEEFFLMEQRQQILLRQSAENIFGEDEENISERNQRMLTQESGTSEETKLGEQLHLSFLRKTKLNS